MCVSMDGCGCGRVWMSIAIIRLVVLDYLFAVCLPP